MSKRILFVGTKVTNDLYKIIKKDLPEEWDIHYTHLTADENYYDLIEEYDNIITWGFKVNLESISSKKNILFLENGAISQIYGMWIDRLGWGDESTLVKEESDLHERPAKHKYLRKVLRYISRNYFKASRIFSYKSKPKGPILFAFQNSQDYPFNYAFDVKCTGHKMDLLFDKLYSAIPNDTILILRPHPKFSADFNVYLDRFIERSGKLPNNWLIDDIKVPLTTSIKNCSLMISVNSTSIQEALCLGIPTIALGRGIYSGNNVVTEQTLDSLNIDKLDHIKFEDVDNFLCRILEDCNIPYATPEDIIVNKHYIKFKESII